MKKIIFTIITIAIIITGFSLKKSVIISKNNIEVYHFYNKSFGQTCTKAKVYIKELQQENPDDFSFKIVNISQKNPKSFIKKYNESGKNIIIFNKKKETYIVSSMRRLIKEKKSKSLVKESFLKELESIL